MNLCLIFNSIQKKKPTRMLWRILKSCNFICKRYGLALFFFQIQWKSGLERFFWFSLLLRCLRFKWLQSNTFFFFLIFGMVEMSCLVWLGVRFFFRQKVNPFYCKENFPRCVKQCGTAQAQKTRQNKLDFFKISLCFNTVFNYKYK